MSDTEALSLNQLLRLAEMQADLLSNRARGQRSRDDHDELRNTLRRLRLAFAAAPGQDAVQAKAARLSLRMWPVVVIEDRYTGVYSHGLWIAVCNADEHGDFLSMLVEGDGPWGDDTEAMNFWWSADEDRSAWLGLGNTPEQAINALVAQKQRASS